MRKVVLLILASVVLALLNLGFSFVSEINLVWVAVVALMVVGFEDLGIAVALVAGIVFDIFLHSNVGTTSLAILIPSGVCVLARFTGFGERLWQKVILVFVMLLFAGLIASLELALLESIPFELVGDFGDRVTSAILSGLVTLGVYGAILIWSERHQTRRSVKL